MTLLKMVMVELRPGGVVVIAGKAAMTPISTEHLGSVTNTPYDLNTGLRFTFMTATGNDFMTAVSQVRQIVFGANNLPMASLLMNSNGWICIQFPMFLLLFIKLLIWIKVFLKSCLDNIF